MSNKKQLVLDAFNNKATERVPVGFWFHYAENELGSSYEVPAYRQQNLEGHKKFVKEFQPDFVKLMSDGYFFEPETAKFLKGIKSAEDLFNLKPISENDKWILDQVSLVKELTNDFGKDLFTAYNVFAPATALKWGVGGDKKLAELIKENQDAVFYALSVISQNTQVLAKAVIKEGHADGIYLSVQSIQDVSVGPDLYSEVISPSEIAVLTAASSVGGTNILHVWVNEGRYDAHVDIKLSFENNVLKDGAPYSAYRDSLTFIPYKGIPTWPIFNIRNKKFAEDYDRAILQLKGNGTLSRLAVEYFGEDVSEFLK